MKIYTKTGDNGETGFIGGRTSKDSLRIEALGTIDELNAAIGLVISKINNYLPTTRNSDKKTFTNSTDSFLREDKKNDSFELTFHTSTLTNIQNTLFPIGAVIAGGNAKVKFDELITQLEKSIDIMDSALPPLKNFILPGGNEIAANIHFVRAVCRRAERTLVKYLNSLDNIQLAQLSHMDTKQISIGKTMSVTNAVAKSNDDIKNSIKYLNRLSDYFFVLARFINKLNGVEDVIWSKK